MDTTGNLPPSPYPRPDGGAWSSTASANWTMNTTATATLGPDWPSDELDLIIAIATSFILVLMILTTIIGNVFVMAAILLDRHLQSVANYLILSLAVADLLVAILVMPLGAVKEITKKWIMGPFLCDFWTSSDVLCCTASILHLLAIAVDRYWAVTQPHYIHSRSSTIIWVLISLVWVMSIVVALAPLFGWKDAAWEERVNEGDCMVSQELSYQIFATSATFFLPLVLILLLYWKIFLTARMRLRNRAAAKRKVPQASVLQTAATAGIIIKQKNVKVSTNGSGNLETTTFSVAETSPAPPGPHPHPSPPGQPAAAALVTAVHCSPPSTPRHQNGAIQHASMGCQTDDTAPLPATKIRKEKKEKKHISLEAKREKKAAKTLAIVTGAFIICWLPFFVMAVIAPLCQDCIPDGVFSFFLWLGYFNSTLNPIIYTVFSPEFRQAFKKLLCGRSNNNSYRPRHLQ